MDKIDHQLLRLLKSNARVTASEMSNVIHLSVSSVLERVRRMEQSGIIRKYTAIVDEKAVGYDLTALMEVSLEHPCYYDTFVQAVQDDSHVVDCYYLAANFDFSLKICCTSSAELEAIHRRLKSIQGVANTQTHFVLKEIKNIYSPDLSE